MYLFLILYLPAPAFFQTVSVVRLWAQVVVDVHKIRCARSCHEPEPVVFCERFSCVQIFKASAIAAKAQLRSRSLTPSPPKPC